MMKVPTPHNPKDLDVVDATFTAPDLTSFCRLDDLGLTVTGQHITPTRAVLACRVVDDDEARFCSRCGAAGLVRGSVTRRLAHIPFGWRPTTLKITLRRFWCVTCKHVWRQDMTRAAEPRSKLSRGALRWALEALVVNSLSVARVADCLAGAWHPASDAVLEVGRRLVINDPARFDGVKVVGVDEHSWRHTRFGSKWVTVIIDLTPARDGTGHSRLLDVVEGRSKEVFKTWLQERPKAWTNAVEIVAMDGFTGFKTAAAEAMPKATAVMDPFHVVRNAGDALTRCRQRVHQQLHGHRGRKNEPL
jgi:transposase